MRVGRLSLQVGVGGIGCPLHQGPALQLGRPWTPRLSLSCTGKLGPSPSGGKARPDSHPYSPAPAAWPGPGQLPFPLSPLFPHLGTTKSGGNMLSGPNHCLAHSKFDHVVLGAQAKEGLEKLGGCWSVSLTQTLPPFLHAGCFRGRCGSPGHPRAGLEDHMPPASGSGFPPPGAPERPIVLGAGQPICDRKTGRAGVHLETSATERAYRNC